MCVCVSIMPGSTVMFERSMTFAFGSAFSAAPTLSIRLPRMTIV